MAFQVKSFAGITAGMINRVRATCQRVTDFNVGAIIRTLLEAFAQELDDLYQRMIAGLIEAIPVSVYSSFDFPARAALPSIGLPRVIVTASSAALLIPTGSIFITMDGTLRFTSTSDATIAPSATFGDVPVVCATPGVVGNLPAGTSFTVSPAPVGIVSASNLAPFVDGLEAEGADQRKDRFRQYIQTLSRGTPPSLLYALLQKTDLRDTLGNVTERVRFAVVDEPYTRDTTQPPSLVNCYIHNGIGGTSTALVARGLLVVQGYYDSSGKPVPGYKAAGVHVTLAAATETAVPITAVVTVALGFDAAGAATAATGAVISYILDLPPGSPFVAARAEVRAMAIPGVVNYAPSVGGSDVTAAVNVKLMPGTIAITGTPASSSGGATAVGTAP